jgi:hypothetical protein
MVSKIVQHFFNRINIGYTYKRTTFTIGCNGFVNEAGNCLPNIPPTPAPVPVKPITKGKGKGKGKNKDKPKRRRTLQRMS